MKNKNLVWGLVGIIVIIGAVYWHSQTPAAQVSTIRIGAILSLTGDAAVDSSNVRRGMELAQEDLAKEGINVDIKYQDDQTDSTHAASAAQYLLSTYHPQAVIGPVWTFLIDSATPTLNQAGVVSFAPSITSDLVHVTSPYHFNSGARSALAEPAIAAWLKARNIKNVEIIAEQSPWGDEHLAAYKNAVHDAGGEATIVPVPANSNDPAIFADAMLKAKASSAEVILWTGGLEGASVALVNKRTQLGSTVPIIDASTVYRDLLSRGAVTTKQMQDVYTLDTPIPPAFIKKFEAKYHQAPGNYADRSYDALMMLAKAITAAQIENGNDVAASVRNLHYQGYAASYEFDQNGDVKTGEFVVDPVNSVQ